MSIQLLMYLISIVLGALTVGGLIDEDIAEAKKKGTEYKISYGHIFLMVFVIFTPFVNALMFVVLGIPMFCSASITLVESTKEEGEQSKETIKIEDDQTTEH